ncbi:MAG TPA: lipopolysaccharide kinase InaA family protein [Planctomycetota bacterium]|nr:lipopolysaccharide kinase InaA family protein [Planctomycetota bacterium]
MLLHGAELVTRGAGREILAGLRTPREVIARWGVLPEGGRARSAVRELRLPQGRFFLKVYAYSGLWRLRTLFIVSRARREYRNLLRLAELGFDVPEPLAYGQERTLGFVSVSFLLTRAVEPAVGLRDLADRPGSAPFALPGTAERRALLSDFARTLRRAHDAGFFIHTLRAKNLLLGRRDGRWALHVLDVPFAGIWRYRIFRRAGRVRDLACLMRVGRMLLSRTDRMRFARAYGADRTLLRRAQAYQEKHYP